MTDEQTAREPLRLWWARPRKLVVLERPGGGGRSHRPARREAEIAWLLREGVRRVASTMPTRHNLDSYEQAGLETIHVPAAWPAGEPERFDRVVVSLRGRLRRGGAMAIHGNRRTDFAAAVAVALLYECWRVDPVDALADAYVAGMDVTPEVCALLAVEWEAVEFWGERGLAALSA